MSDETKHQWIPGDSLADPTHGFPKTPEKVVESAGNARRQAHARIIACDKEMRQNYDLNHVAIGNSIYPFLYSEFTLDGGRYILLINDSEWVSAKPVPPVYAEVKAISHIPLGIWSIIARYANASKGGQWMEPLQHFSMTIREALAHLSEARMPTEIPEILTDSEIIMEAALEFIQRILDNESFTLDQFTEFSHGINPQLVNHQTRAAEAQVTAFINVLEKWKRLIGEQAWSKLYAVCSAQWGLSTENVHQLIISSTMDPEQAASNVFVTSMPLSGIEEARALCGRIVGDRVMARQIFSRDTLRGRENVFSLSSSRDLLSQAAEDVLKNMKDSCPHAEPHFERASKKP